MPTHLDVFLELFDLLVLHLAIQFDLFVLALELLDEEWLNVVRPLADGPSIRLLCIVRLLLKLARQVLNVLFFLDKVDVHCFYLCSQACVLVPRDIVLNLQVTIHVSKVFLLSLPEDGCLVRLDHVGCTVWSDCSRRMGEIGCGCVCTPPQQGLLADRSLTAQQDVARAVVVDDLLVDAVALLSVGAAVQPHPRAIVQAEERRRLVHQALRSHGSRPGKQLSIRALDPSAHLWSEGIISRSQTELCLRD